MAIDLSGGIDPARENVFAERPDDPEMRDSVSFWVVDDRGEVGLPRIGIEAVAANWDAHGIQANVAFPDGRAYRLREDAKSWPPGGPDGRPTVLGAGPLGFRCVEPFRTWHMSFDGTAVQTSTFDLVEGRRDGPLVDVRFEVEATMAVPPWIQGSLLADAHTQLESSAEGDMMGGPRYEQLFRATGTVRVGGGDGDGGGAEQAFTGTGLRIRRQGSAGSPASPATAGSRRCSRAAGRSATSLTRRGTTASPPSTRATSSTGTATSWRPG